MVALADCSGKTVDKHLSFQKGELIHVRDQKDAAWYSGQLRGKVNNLHSSLSGKYQNLFI